MIRRWAAAALGGAIAVLTLLASTAGAAPAVKLDHNVVRVGDVVLVTLDGWPNGPVSITLCGNAAARGSIDCDLQNSLGYGVTPTQPLQRVRFKITTPPVPCPCVIEVSNPSQTEHAHAPVTITGFPTAPVVGNTFEAPLVVNVAVKRAHRGFFPLLRSWLGGPTQYRVTVSILNKSADDVGPVVVNARAGRGRTDQARVIDIKPPDVIAAGETWRTSQVVSLAAPVVGRFYWEVTASATGPAAHGEVVTRHVPWLLVVMTLVLVWVVVAMIIRRVRGRKDLGASSSAPPPEESPSPVPVGGG